MKRLHPSLALLILFSASFTASIPLAAQAALPVPASCPAPDSSKSASYKAGFSTGCLAGFAFEDYYFDSADNVRVYDSDFYCASGKKPPQFDNPAWNMGCNDGHTAGLTAFEANFKAWPASPKPDIYTKCTNLPGYKDLYQTPTWQKDFLVTCAQSYRKAINHPRLADDSEFKDFDLTANMNECDSLHSGAPNYRNGCLAGYLTASEDFENAFLPLSATATDSEIAFVSGKLGNCGLPLSGASDPMSKQRNSGTIKGCIEGYRTAFDAGTNTHGVEVTKFDGFDYRSMKHRVFKDKYILGYEAGFAKGEQVRKNCATKQKSGIAGVSCGVALSAPGSIVPNCVASLSPTDPDGCGLARFVELIQNIIKYLLGIMIPLAVIGIGFGGFKIMTAAGNPSKVEEGYGTIKIVVIGIVIALASYLVVKFIFLALGVQNSVGNVF